MSRPPLTLGRACLTASGLINAICPYIFDWSRTHVFNPNWPPHAKFHNGQTMSTGAALGLLTLYYTWRSTTPAANNDSLRTAAITGSLYFFTALSAMLYPGSAGVDPEFEAEFGEGFFMFWPFSGLAVLPWVGYWLTKRRI